MASCLRVGGGTRLGRDKGELDCHGLPQARWAHELLAGACERRFVSVRPDQIQAEPYRDLPLIADEGEGGGPAAGLSAALNRFPGAAWLLVAADMPLLTAGVLGVLVEQRDPAGLATAFRRADGTPEPLCAIWEPAVRAVATPARGGPAKLLAIDDEGALASVNTPADDEWIRGLCKRTT